MAWTVLCLTCLVCVCLNRWTHTHAPAFINYFTHTNTRARIHSFFLTLTRGKTMFLWQANLKILPCFKSDMVSISVVSHASYLPFPKVGLELNIRRRGERGITVGRPPANGKLNRFSKVLHVCVLSWHHGPYFNGLKRKWEAPSASSFVGGSTALSLFYRRINDTCVAAQVSKGLVWSSLVTRRCGLGVTSNKPMRVPAPIPFKSHERIWIGRVDILTARLQSPMRQMHMNFKLQMA